MTITQKVVVIFAGITSAISNAGEPCRITDDNGNYILLSTGARLKSSLETSHIQNSSGGKLLTSTGDEIIALTFT